MQYVDENANETAPEAQGYPWETFWPPELRAEAVALFEKGYGSKRTSTKLGVPVWTVKKWREEWKSDGSCLMVPCPRKLWSPEIRAEAASLFEEGRDPRNVAAELGVPVPTVYSWKRQWKAGEFRPTYSPGVRPYTEELKDKAYELRLAGLSQDAIRRELGVSITTVAQWLHERGVGSIADMVRKKRLTAHCREVER